MHVYSNLPIYQKGKSKDEYCTLFCSTNFYFLLYNCYNNLGGNDEFVLLVLAFLQNNHLSEIQIDGYYVEKLIWFRFSLSQKAGKKQEIFWMIHLPMQKLYKLMNEFLLVHSFSNTFYR